MKIVLLSGGSGQRLWPLSNDAYSKQYIKFIDHDSEISEKFYVSPKRERCSMLQRVYEQLSAVGLGDDVIIAASEAQKEIIMSQLGDRVKISQEPIRRDTFPAVVIASAFAKDECNLSEDEVIAIVPIDPYVNIDYFYKIIELSEKVTKADNVIGLLGAKPTYPSEKYGYIRGKKYENEFEVDGFAEKPSKEYAEELIKDGALWNCGVFSFKIKTARQWIEKYKVPFSYDELFKTENYEKLRKISFDYEVLEKWEKSIAVVYDGLWKDIGTWNTLAEEMKDKLVGKVTIDETTSNCNVISTLDTPLIVMGAKDMVVVASRDGILVSDKAQSSYLKEQLTKVEIVPHFEERAWGTIKTIDRMVENGIGVKTNLVKILSGKKTSWHRHLRHKEIITVILGEGILSINGTPIKLATGMNFTVSEGVLHQIEAISDLKYIEILMGDIECDDVERLGDIN